MGTAESQKAPIARGIRKVRRAESWLFGGTTALALGIALSLTEYGDLGAQLTLGGFLAAVVGLHLLGRTGPSEQTGISTAPKSGFASQDGQNDIIP